MYRQIDVKLFIKAEKVMDVKKILFIGLSCVGSVICMKGANNDARNISIENVNSSIQEILNE